MTNNEKLKIKKSEETELSSNANDLLTQPAQDEIPMVPKEAVTVCHDLNQTKLLTAKEEKAIHLQRMQREPSEQSEVGLAELMAKITQGMENGVDIQSEVETLPSNNTAEHGIEQPEINQKNEEAMKQENTDIDDKKMLLSKALFNSFGNKAANEIQDNCEFEEVSPYKLCIKPALGVSFNDIEKAKIRKCIQSVYGENVVIALVKDTPYVSNEPVTNESGLARSDFVVSNSCNNPQWRRFKAELTKVLLKKHEEKIALHILKNWFDKLRVSDDSTSQKLILVGSVFTVQWIDDKFGLELENAVLASNLAIELRDEANRNRPLIFSKQTIKRG